MTTAAARRRYALSLVPDDALLIDSWKYKAEPESGEIKIWGDGEFACVFVESHLDDGTRDGKTIFSATVT